MWQLRLRRRIELRHLSENIDRDFGPWFRSVVHKIPQVSIRKPIAKTSADTRWYLHILTSFSVATYHIILPIMPYFFEGAERPSRNRFILSYACTHVNVSCHE